MNKKFVVFCFQFEKNCYLIIMIKDVNLCNKAFSVTIVMHLTKANFIYLIPW